jgi:ankyrin repeat protein
MAGPQLTGKLSGIDLAKNLIARGADVNARSTREVQNGYGAAAAAPRTGATPLMLAAKAADYELMRTLLANGANPNVPQITHTTPLMAAAGVGIKAPGEDGGSNEDALESVKLLLGLDVRINEANDEGWTPLHGAAFRGANDIVQLLIDRGADVKARTKHGRFQNDPGVTPLGLANGITIGVISFRQELTAEFLRKLYISRGIPFDPDEMARGVDSQAKRP